MPHLAILMFFGDGNIFQVRQHGRDLIVATARRNVFVAEIFGYATQMATAASVRGSINHERSLSAVELICQKRAFFSIRSIVTGSFRGPEDARQCPRRDDLQTWRQIA
jgi:hypothetical protein